MGNATTRKTSFNREGREGREGPTWIGQRPQGTPFAQWVDMEPEASPLPCV